MLTRRHIPNLLTFARVAAVPLCLALMLLNPACKAIALFWIFVAASITDFLDGYLARKWNVVSPLGALLDPIADKLLVALMLVYVLWALILPPIIVPISPLFLPVALILLRELYISGLREFLAIRQIALPVSKGGKWKTAVQMLAITLLLAAMAFGAPISNPTPLTELCANAGLALLYLAALLAVSSAISYTRASWKHLR